MLKSIEEDLKKFGDQLDAALSGEIVRSQQSLDSIQNAREVLADILRNKLDMNAMNKSMGTVKKVESEARSGLRDVQEKLRTVSDEIIRLQALTNQLAESCQSLTQSNEELKTKNAALEAEIEPLRAFQQNATMTQTAAGGGGGFQSMGIQASGTNTFGFPQTNTNLPPDVEKLQTEIKRIRQEKCQAEASDALTQQRMREILNLSERKTKEITKWQSRCQALQNHVVSLRGEIEDLKKVQETAQIAKERAEATTQIFEHKMQEMNGQAARQLHKSQRALMIDPVMPRGLVYKMMQETRGPSSANRRAHFDSQPAEDTLFEGEGAEGSPRMGNKAGQGPLAAVSKILMNQNQQDTAGAVRGTTTVFSHRSNATGFCSSGASSVAPLDPLDSDRVLSKALTCLKEAERLTLSGNVPLPEKRVREGARGAQTLAAIEKSLEAVVGSGGLNVRSWHGESGRTTADGNWPR
uniref:Uncharacterized protein n=1 Tax=Chromera velia CCMP2878 TaxID=1169474 RepID=A0A0G4FR33_9ALVE|eukprot:Cvel_445.t1-p1 / transcript=Cvel_445.t1 / gene=Cvel_445 / organism=Chromera_velia_CCMP2878 / gene_product=hypothetical protein / transcript_product=hypothetical protein / location=Cvel_scaffold14:117882-119425(-) / protein_length=466 / sequence_SO=supercontig / SO=protein_coding / is_pseudo=false